MPQYQEIWSTMTNALDESMIKLIEDDGTVRFVPRDEGNMDWRAYLQWLDDGKHPLKHDEEPEAL